MKRIATLRGTALPCLMLAALLVGAAAGAEDTCPALNRARAAAALVREGQPADVQLAIEWHAASDYICTYTGGQNTLRIAVSLYHARDGWPSYAARCFAPGGPLVGIGDEAVLCNTPDGAKPAQQEVLGHVRDTFFDLRMSFGGATKPPPDVLRHVAEQVAGNLF
jgi:hypothetical protein